jgi:hypothetical protein
MEDLKIIKRKDLLENISSNISSIENNIRRLEKYKLLGKNEINRLIYESNNFELLIGMCKRNIEILSIKEYYNSVN